MTLYAGLDWASAQHAVCVIDGSGTVVKRFDVEHTAAGLHSLCRKLGNLAGDGQPIPIAIERPSGLLVDTLVDAGHPIVPIHPNAVKASRTRYAAAASKSDTGDAYLLADLLRTDGHRFRRLRPPTDAVRALRSKVRTRDDLVATHVRLVNQLHALLETFWPGAACIFAKTDSPIALAFLRKFPAPIDAAKLDEKRLAAFLASQHYPGRRSPEELLQRLRSAPTGLVGPLEEQAKRGQVLALLAVLRPVLEQIDKLTDEIEHDVAQLSGGKVVMSLPCAGKLNAAQIFAELGEDPARFDSAEHLAAESGLVPVTRASGKHRTVLYRFACNKRLRQALTCWAHNSRLKSAWAADTYNRARARGCDHSHAIRILARAWCRVLWRCWRDGVAYDASLHGGAVALRPPGALPEEELANTA
jgi:transposase